MVREHVHEQENYKNIRRRTSKGTRRKKTETTYKMSGQEQGTRTSSQDQGQRQEYQELLQDIARVMSISTE